MKFCIAHRRLAGYIPGSATNLRPHEAGNITDFTIDADIHHHDLNPTMAREDVDCCPSAQEVQYHLPRHGFRISTDSLLRNTVIRGQGENHFVRALQALLFADRNQPRRNLFETAEASQGFCQAIQPRHCPRTPFRRERRYGS